MMRISLKMDDVYNVASVINPTRLPGRAPGWPQRWSPGGDIRLATSHDGFRWSKRVGVLPQLAGGNVPKVRPVRRSS